MTRLIRSEVRKVMTTRLWWGMLLGALAFSALSVVAQIASNGARNDPAGPLSDVATQRSIFASSVSGYVFSVVVGVIVITTEFRHFTSRPTFLIEPRRFRVVVAKLVVALGVGLVYGVACVALSLAIAVPWLSARGVHLDWVPSGLVVVLVGAVFVVGIFAVVGVGVGVLVRNQVAAVIGVLAYLFVLEPIATVVPVVKDYYRWLPGAAAAALTSLPRRGAPLLTNWQGGLLLLGWGLFFAALGCVLTVRRDIP